MLKKAVSIFIAICLIAVPAASVGAAGDGMEGNDKGLSLSPGAFCGATIKVADAGLEAGKAYTIEYVIHAIGTTSFRVRYTDNDGSNGVFKYNDETNGAHSSPGAVTNGLTASQVPAYFQSSVASDSVSLLTVNFTFGANIADLQPLTMDYIGIFGGFGTSGYEVLGMRLKDAAGQEISAVGDMTGSITTPLLLPPSDFFTLTQEGGLRYQLHRPTHPESEKNTRF